ncbi:MAG TPA: hypothetical protein VG675_12375 [Bryobacteraceae bacterium]|nr:hypothetical protein [Bryobacteraceae bacterium]
MELDKTAIRTQIDRVLRSKALEGSDSYRKLLAYLAEKSIAGEEHRLKEYTVALEAFGKPESYDPRHDSTVRIQAGRLRQKLAQYYLTEGARDPIVVDLPKGGFQLHFSPSGSNGAANLPVAPRRRPRLALLFPVLSVLLALWAAYVTWALVKTRDQALPAKAAWSPELEQLWAPFLQSSRPIRVCLGTPLFAYFHEVGFFRYPWANQWPELMRSKGLKAVEDSSGVNPLPWYGFASAGEADAAFQLGRLLATRRPDILLTHSRMLSWQQASEDELIFVGPPKFNNQLDQLPAATDIVVEPRGIRNLKPRPGEPAFLEDRYEVGQQFNGETYALISVLPGLSGVGQVLILGGNASPAAYAAAQWLTQPDFARKLVYRLRLPNGRLPRNYQVVLRVQFRDGIPLESSCVLQRVIRQ